MNDSQFSSIYNQPDADALADIQRGFITRVYAWMTGGLFITAAAALVTIYTPGLLMAIIGNRLLFFGLLIGELVLVMVLTGLVAKVSPGVAGLMFAGYAVLNGVTLSILVLIYTTSSIAATFGITACTFGIMTLFGYTTQLDLTKLGSLLMMGLIGILLASIVNMFLGNSAIYYIIAYLGVLIFVGLIAYDTQKLKRLSLGVSQDGQLAQRASILGALTLYLDFVNLFLFLLRILGKRRR